MFKFVVLLVVVAIAAAGFVSPVVYEAAPVASGYEYQHTIETPDYVNHASVSAPLNGFVRSYASPLVKSFYAEPAIYRQVW